MHSPHMLQQQSASMDASAAADAAASVFDAFIAELEGIGLRGLSLSAAAVSEADFVTLMRDLLRQIRQLAAKLEPFSHAPPPASSSTTPAAAVSPAPTRCRSRSRARRPLPQPKRAGLPGGAGASCPKDPRPKRHTSSTSFAPKTPPKARVPIPPCTPPPPHILRAAGLLAGPVPSGPPPVGVGTARGQGNLWIGLDLPAWCPAGRPPVGPLLREWGPLS